MNFKGNKRKWLSFCVVILFGIIILPGMRVKAEEAQNVERTITSIPVTYDITNETLGVEISTNAKECYLAYYIYSYSTLGEMTLEERFAHSVKTTEACVKVELQDAEQVYVWFVDEQGQRLTTENFDSVYGEEGREKILCENPDVEYINGDSLADFDPQFSINNGILSYQGNDRVDSLGILCLLNDGRTYSSGIPAGQYSKTGGTKALPREIFLESGSFDFYIWQIGNGVCSKPKKITYVYTKPEQQLNSVKNLQWVNGTVGTISFSPVEGAEEYIAMLHYINADGTIRVNKDGTSYFKEIDGKLIADFSRFMDKENVTYKVGVRALSGDIESIAHSDEVFSSIYDPSDASESVEIILKDILDKVGVDSVEKADADTLTNIYNNASEEEKEKIAEALKDGLCELQTNELKIAMQTNKEIRDTVAAIEVMTGVTVSTDIAEEAAGLIETGAVRVLGAGLNADAGVNNVSLKITKESEVNLGTNYKKAIPLGITLTGVSKAASGLDIPVTITMPVPVGIDMSKLVILHMNPDGTVNEKLGINNGYSYDYENRTITFTVTHFSTFVFAEADDNQEGTNPGTGGAEEDTKPGDNNTGNNTKPDDNNVENNTNNNSSNNNNNNANNNANSNNNSTSNSGAGSNNNSTASTATASPKTGEPGLVVVSMMLVGAIAGLVIFKRKRQV